MIRNKKIKKYPVIMEHYKDLLKAAIRQSKKKRKDIANQAGISVGYLGHLENGVRETKPATLFRLSEALEIDPKPFMVSWLNENMQSVQYKDLESLLPKGTKIEDLTELYRIPEAENILSKIEGVPVTELQKMPLQDILQLKLSLQNCLNLLKELKNVKAN